ncbi:hypothetical protein B0H10DRAFT_1071518 [Mycena sp. CBHHK59/15]|nr:hypothetical protein B0H10DRAFT_1071518 [Mycena sp. CBHHK59/15]
MDIGFRQAVLRDTSQGAVVSGRWLWRRTNILYMGSDSWLGGPNGAPQDVVAKTGQGRCGFVLVDRAHPSTGTGGRRMPDPVTPKQSQGQLKGYLEGSVYLLTALMYFQPRRVDSARVAPHKSEHHIFARTTCTGSDSSWQACSLLWTSVLVRIRPFPSQAALFFFGACAPGIGQYIGPCTIRLRCPLAFERGILLAQGRACRRQPILSRWPEFAYTSSGPPVYCL